MPFFCYDLLPSEHLLGNLLKSLYFTAIFCLVFEHHLRGLLCKLVAIASGRLTSLVLIFCVSFTTNYWIGSIDEPYPRIHDEWSYLLAGDTYSQGRLTNPTHEHWRHFETFHVLSKPTYMSKYPPGGGLSLALGQVLFGRPIVGVWIILAFASASLCWMLQGFLSNRISLICSFLVAIHVPIIMCWGQSYWGGGVAFLGGCLLFGSVCRAISSRGLYESVGLGIMFGLAAVALSLSRPMEGLIAFLVALLPYVWNGLQYWGSQRKKWIAFALGASAVGIPGLAFIGSSNDSVTGNYRMFPHVQYSRQYHRGGSIIIWTQKGTREIEMGSARMKRFGEEWSFRDETKSFVRYAKLVLRKLGLLYRFFPFFFGICLLPALGLSGSNRIWARYAIVLFFSIVVFELQLGMSWLFPHYIAPFACLFYLLLALGLSRWQAIALRIPVFRFVIPLAMIFSLLQLETLAQLNQDKPFRSKRVLVETILKSQPGDDLIFVDYTNFEELHQEFVFNAAEIDQQDIVWANDLSLDQNEALIQHYGNTRQSWVWRVHDKVLINLVSKERFNVW